MGRMTKKGVILASIILASFVFGSIVTAVGPDDASFLQDLWNAIFGIEEEIDEISDDVIVLKTSLDLLERKHDLETRIAILEIFSTGLEPDFHRRATTADGII